MDWSVVEVNEEHAAALRSHLVDGPDAWEPLQAKTTTDEDAAGYMSMLYAAFAVAVRRKFSTNPTVGQVVRFVADLRAAAADDANLIDPLVAEDMIRRVIGAPSPRDGGPDDPETVLSAQNTMLLVLVAEAEFDMAGLGDFVIDAAEFAKKWVAARQGESRNL